LTPERLAGRGSQLLLHELQSPADQDLVDSLACLLVVCVGPSLLLTSPGFAGLCTPHLCIQARGVQSESDNHGRDR
jgi:hypothetical protein